MPVTLPDPSSDMLVAVVLHTPPGVKLLNDMVDPVQTDEAPPIPDVAGLTVTWAVTKQPMPVA